MKAEDRISTSSKEWLIDFIISHIQMYVSKDVSFDINTISLKKYGISTVQMSYHTFSQDKDFLCKKAPISV